MRKFTILLLLILYPIVATAPIWEVDEQALCKEWQDRKFIENIKTTEFSAENLNRLITIICKHPDIVYKQARLESGEFKSKLFLDYNNIFGMKHPNVRPTTAIGEAMGHAVYSHWSDAVIDYQLYQQWYEAYLQVDFNQINYYDFLKMYGYAMDKYYVNKLKKLI